MAISHRPVCYRKAAMRRVGFTTEIPSRPKPKTKSSPKYANSPTKLVGNHLRSKNGKHCRQDRTLRRHGASRKNIFLPPSSCQTGRDPIVAYHSLSARGRSHSISVGYRTAWKEKAVPSHSTPKQSPRIAQCIWPPRPPSSVLRFIRSPAHPCSRLAIRANQ